ncbi:MAG TPA: hypothetical protein IAC04_05745 [Candidatus Coprenecus stercoravium]|uniref:Uncharacterized protein n=1 Tax=Candidatus Coprenecus stercoravium TaxID=2840735 RepID=A0A9D2GRC6_9BACT|nr:hypothetical protein [Candidatus Coprenecus stercoravium]
MNAMKGYIYTICFVLLTAAVPLKAQDNSSGQDSPTYLDRMEWILSDVSMTSDSVTGKRSASVDMAIKWKDRPHARTQHTVCIVPVLISADSSSEFRFAPVYIDGRIRAKAIERRSTLDKRSTARDESCLILETGRKAPETVRYTSSIPYDPAMLDGRLALYETVHGCAECLVETDTLFLAPVLPPYVPQWSSPGFMQSPSGDDKNREKHHTASLEFAVNRAEIRPDYMDNAAALEGIMESIRTALNDTVYTLRAVRFLGFASPDGPERFNTSLARRRAASLADHIKSMDTSIPDSLYIVESGAENWDGFFKAAAADAQLASNPVIAEVKAALREDNRDSCERVLKQDKALYDRLRKDILPGLRRTEYVIEYDLRDFSPEEAEALWQEHPEWLSINELYSVAGLYGKDDPRYLEVLMTAADTYPSDAAATHNAAMALYDKGMVSEAVSLLSGAPFNPETLNTLGIIYCSEKMYQEARSAFSLAAGSGHEGAAHNLSELENIMRQL